MIQYSFILIFTENISNPVQLSEGKEDSGELDKAMVVGPKSSYPFKSLSRNHGEPISYM